MSEYSCTACQDLRDDAPAFVQNGVTDAICNSLHNNTGFNPNLTVRHNDEEDLHNANDCLIGVKVDQVMSQDVCDWRPFIKKVLGNLYELLKAIICSLGGLWRKLSRLIEILGGEDGITKVAKYSFTATAESFDHIGTVTSAGGSPFDHNLGEYFSPGSNVQGQEYHIKIPVADMDTVIGCWGQPRVVGNKLNPATVAIQQAYKSGNYYIVNFDIYELSIHDAAPYDITIDFFVLGTKAL